MKATKTFSAIPSIIQKLVGRIQTDFADHLQMYTDSRFFWEWTHMHKQSMPGHLSFSPPTRPGNEARGVSAPPTRPGNEARGVSALLHVATSGVGTLGFQYMLRVCTASLHFQLLSCKITTSSLIPSSFLHTLRGSEPWCEAVPPHHCIHHCIGRRFSRFSTSQK